MSMPRSASGNDGSAGSSKNLYFTAGPDDESHGPFGVLEVSSVPEPDTWATMLLGFGLVGGAMRSRRRKKLAAS